METITSLTRTNPFQSNGQFLSSKELVESFFKDYHFSDVQAKVWTIIKELYISKNKHQQIMERRELISFLENLHDFLMQCYLSTTIAGKEASDSKTRPQS